MRVWMGLLTLQATIAAALVAAPARAAEIVDFNGMADAFTCNGIPNFDCGSGSIRSGDYSFLAEPSSLGFLSVDAQSDIVNDGTARLLAANHIDITLQRSDSGFFDLLGTDYGGSFIDPDKRERWATGVEIIGRRADGRAISTIVSLDPTDPVLHSINFTDYRDLRSVTFRATGTRGGANDFEFVLDNIRVAAAVPEPQTWVLMAAGLALLGRAVRRRPAA